MLNGKAIIINFNSFFRCKDYFDEDGTQIYYVFEPISKYLKVAYVNDINNILS